MSKPPTGEDIVREAFDALTDERRHDIMRELDIHDDPCEICIEREADAMTERGRFEEWYVKRFDHSPAAWFASENRYYYGYTQDRWEAWQAARSAAIQECADALRTHCNSVENGCEAAAALLALKER